MKKENARIPKSAMRLAVGYRFAALFLLMAFGLMPIAALASSAPAIQGLGPHDALLVVSPAGETVVAHNPDRQMVPASTLKVVTALAALHYLGADHRFPTDFCLDGRNNLIIKGYGDPFLVSEVIAAVAAELARALPMPVQDIVIDDSFFAEPLVIPGVSASTNPYDAPNGALCANFNTVFFTHAGGRLRSAEAQTPLLPMVRERIRQSGLRQGRIVLSRRQDEAPLYAGNLFRHFLLRAGVEIQGTVRMAKAAEAGCPQSERILRHRSPYPLTEVVRRLLEFSNNFTANQLLLAMGARHYGTPATLDKGVRALQVYAGEVLGIRKGVFAEGSGISRGNRLSVRDMMTALDHFEPHAHLMAREGGEYYKTGTLSDVRTRAGYIEAAPGVFYRFALFRNRTGRPTGPVMRQVHRLVAGR